MPYTMEDYRRESREEALKYLEELPAEELLKHISPEERLKGLPPEVLLKRVPLEKRLEGLSPEEIENYLAKLKGRSAPT